MFLLPVAVLLATLVASVAVGRRRRTRGFELLTLGGATLVALYLAEAVLAFAALPAAERAAWLARRAFDRRSRAEVVRERRLAGVDAVPRVVPFAFIVPDGLRYGEGPPLFPLGGVPMAETVLCNETGDWIVFRADEHGFRNPPGLHHAGEVDVAIVGDSFIHGECVADGDDLASLLRAGGRRALSLGISGDGPLLELATLVEYAEPLRPKVVVWSFFEGNDLGDLASEARSPTLVRYLDAGAERQGLVERRDEIARRLRLYVDEQLRFAPAPGGERGALAAWLRLESMERRLTSLDRQGASSRNGAATAALDPLFSRVVAAAARRVEGWGGRMIALYLGRGGDGELSPALHQAVLEAFAADGVPVIDFHGLLRRRGRVDDLFPPGSRVHYDADGYRLLVAELSAALSAPLP